MNIYKTKKINSSLTLICEELSEYSPLVMSLVEGKDYAAIVDTGMGVTGDLDQFIKTLTDKPVKYCLLTHGDPDHVGGAALFPNIYMSKLDDDVLPWGLSLKTRLDYVGYMSEHNEELMAYSREHIVKEEKIEYKDICDGQEFDLGGGVVLKAFLLPGHSKGSMCFINEKEKYVLTGDAINPYVWLWLDRCPSIKEYKKNVLKFKDILGMKMEMYCGHMMEVMPENLIEDMIYVCDEILAGNIKNDEPLTGMYLEDLVPQTVNAKIHCYGENAVTYSSKNLR